MSDASALRSNMISLIKNIKSVNYKVSEELPFSNSGTPLYLKNPKQVYIDNPDTSIESLIPIMNGFNIDVEITTIRAFFANDAKQQPKDYYDIVRDIKNIKDEVSGNYYKRECTVELNYENDISYMTFEFRYSKIFNKE